MAPTALIRAAAVALAVLLAAGRVGAQAVVEENLPTFDIWEYAITGNTLVDRREIERTVYPYLGPDKTISDVETAARELEILYKESGYPTVIVNIPEQNVSEGIVTLDVVQGEVDRLRIVNSRYYSLGKIREAVPSLAEGKVPYFPQVQEELADLNRVSADRRVRPVFKAGRTTGAVAAELQVEDRLPLHGSVRIDDRDTQNTTRLRTTVGARYTNLWQRNHSISMNYQVAPERTADSKVLSGTYLIPLPNRDLLVFYGVNSDSDVATAGDINVIGNGIIVGARYIKPLPVGEDYFHSLTFGIDYKDFDEDVSLDPEETLQTPIEYMHFSAEYRGGLTKERSRFNFKTGVNFGVRDLFNSEFEFEDKRFLAKPNYFYLRAGADYLYDFGKYGQVFVSAEGQVSPSPLINNEQFTIGGVATVRGYFESQLLGDDGLIGRAELRSPSFAGAVYEELRELRLFAFADGGLVHVRERLPGQQRGQEIASAGFGALIRGPLGLNGSVAWAFPLQESGVVDVGESRLHFFFEYEM